MPDLTVMTWNIQDLFPVGHVDGPATQQEYATRSLASPRSSTLSSQTSLPFKKSGPSRCSLTSTRLQHRL
jgi:hypothetical protein